jgi:predicted enzyme related to lactoylglutathione lyase
MTLRAEIMAALLVGFGALLCQSDASGREAITGSSEMPAGHITGVGGIFFKSNDPKALAAWYRDVLGINVQDWGGATLPTDAPGHPPVVVWSPFPATSEHMAPSTREFMVNFAVDDLDAFAARLEAKGVAVHRQPPDPNGLFAWILDPDGTKIEFWQPNRP